MQSSKEMYLRYKKENPKKRRKLITCICGYNTLNQTYKTAANTTMEEIMVSDHT